MRLIQRSVPVIASLVAVLWVLAGPAAAEEAAPHATPSAAGADAAPPADGRRTPSGLQRRAADAATAFYAQHGYKPGDGFTSLAAFYPSAGAIDINGAQRTGAEQISMLEAYFKSKRYTSFEIVVVPGTLAFDCESAERCIVRGQTRASYQTEDNPTPRASLTNFCLRLDLRCSPKVIAEHAGRLGKDVSCG